MNNSVHKLLLSYCFNIIFQSGVFINIDFMISSINLIYNFEKKITCFNKWMFLMMYLGIWAILSIFMYLFNEKVN